MNIRFFSSLPCLEGTTDPDSASLPTDGVREYRMEDGRVRSFTACGPGRIRCRAGRCWLTRDGDAQDYLLAAGEEWAAAANERLVLQALGTASVEVSGMLALPPAGHGSSRLSSALPVRRWTRAVLAWFGPRAL